MRRFLTLLALPVLTTQAAAQGVIVVDDNAGPGVTTDSIQTAIDLASSGDLILVRPGEYAPF
ncbi:MAG: hypothetical protein ACYSWX_06825, partial [Planctomycetota bacterium]